MKRTSKSLQAKDLHVSHIGHIIVLLCMQLEVNYTEDLKLPGMLLGDDDLTDNLLTDLFGENFQTGIMSILSSFLY